MIKNNAINRVKKVLFSPKFVYYFGFGGGCNTGEGQERKNAGRATPTQNGARETPPPHPNPQKKPKKSTEKIIFRA